MPAAHQCSQVCSQICSGLEELLDSAERLKIRAIQLLNSPRTSETAKTEARALIIDLELTASRLLTLALAFTHLYAPTLAYSIAALAHKLHELANRLSRATQTYTEREHATKHNYNAEAA